VTEATNERAGAATAFEGSRASRVLRVIVTVEWVLAGSLLAAVLVLSFAQVIARYVFDAPFIWSEELARYGLIWMTFAASAFVMASGEHISIDMVSRPFGRRGRVALELVSMAVVLAACLVVLVGSAEFVRDFAAVRSPTLRLPLAFVYGATFVGFALLAVHALINMFVAVRTGRPVWDVDEETDRMRGVQV
jgi:TRAP-type transport system small permease protein